MIKKLMSTTASSLILVAMAAGTPALSQSPDQQSSQTIEQMRDGLLGKPAREGVGQSRGASSPGTPSPGSMFGASRGVSLPGAQPSVQPSAAPYAEPSAEHQQFMKDLVRNSQTRSPALPGPQRLDPNKSGKAASNNQTGNLSANDRQKLSNIIKQNKLPSINLVIYFDYNSAAISSRSMVDLVKLGQVMLDPKLKGANFLVAGHTDAKGNARYNLSLSERRARSVQDFLTRSFRIRPETLIPVGYGEEQLKDEASPFAAANRRVQIVNINSMK